MLCTADCARDDLPNSPHRAGGRNLDARTADANLMDVVVGAG